MRKLSCSFLPKIIFSSKNYGKVLYASIVRAGKQDDSRTIGSYQSEERRVPLKALNTEYTFFEGKDDFPFAPFVFPLQYQLVLFSGVSLTASSSSVKNSRCIMKLVKKTWV